MLLCKNESNADAKGRGCDLNSATLFAPIRTRVEQVAALDSSKGLSNVADAQPKSAAPRVTSSMPEGKGSVIISGSYAAKVRKNGGTTIEKDVELIKNNEKRLDSKCRVQYILDIS